MTAVPASTKSPIIPAAVPCGSARNTASISGQGAPDRVAGRREVRVDATEGIVVAIATLQPDQRDVRVSDEEPDQLGADIAGRPDDPDPDPALAVGALGAGRSVRATKPVAASRIPSVAVIVG